MDRLDALRAFVAVATQQSFVEAARRLRLSPSAVTRGVAQLEDSLGLMLFHRTTRSVTLTERGRIYLEDCRQILDELDQADRRVRGEDAQPRGELAVAAPILFGRLHILPIVNGLLAEHRDLSVRLSLSDRNVQLAEEGIDVAIRIGELADSSLIALRLGEVTRVLVASPAYLAARGRPAAPAELADHDLITFEGIGPASDWRPGAGRQEPRLSVNSADAALAAAEAGLGITRALSYQVKAGVEAGRLVPVLQAFAPPPIPVSALHPARRVASANVAAFMSAARARFRAHPLTPVEAWMKL
ncbi:LysR substrate-binding domain-containing protein [Phenylobacterium aquaticum]|uniref:LysR substrate-binding domain-containing protein n=1 Tax=Phenylobacterium aquaticum TaxID=1763816 RepID=UPI0026EA9726|nr:LysR substrate-binding domain-containing protein [Phenylobacterium aquaticum]